MEQYTTIEQGCVSLCQAYAELVWKYEDDCWKLGRRDSTLDITIYAEDEKITLCTPEWHGHFTNIQDAINYAYALLSGIVTTEQLFCNNYLAATWVEDTSKPDDERFHVAIYFSPFDPFEWQTGDGLVWKQVKTSRKHIGKECKGTIVSEVVLDNSPGDKFGRFGVLEDEYGAPPEGMRWLLLMPGGLLHAIPNAYRFDREFWENNKSDDFTRIRYINSQNTIIWFTLGFKPTEKSEIEEYSKPRLIAKNSFELIEGYSDWERTCWEVEFDNGSSRMLASIEMNRPVVLASDDHYQLLDIITSTCRTVIF